MPYCILDDPIIACMERTGYPPWMLGYSYDEDDCFEEEEEVDPDLELWEEIMSNLEYYGTPLGPCLYELPPVGGTTAA